MQVHLRQRQFAQFFRVAYLAQTIPKDDNTAIAHVAESVTAVPCPAINALGIKKDYGGHDEDFDLPSSLSQFKERNSSLGRDFSSLLSEKRDTAGWG
jgi:hypothetical protein